jgi:MFS-type transporter involved in bile tolerance (Atg22 family)
MNTVFWQVMAFYALLSCVIAPLIGYKLKGQSGLGQGYVVGSIICVGLWLTVGKKFTRM